MSLTLRLRPATDTTLKLKLALAASTPELDSAVNAANTAKVAAEAAETNAETAETNAAASASAASTSATNAANSASSASTSAMNASTSASNAATQATNASNSASAASTSASNAATSETNASNSEIAAAASAAAAAAAADNFDDVYLGSKSSDPTLDNDGNALVEGQLYWNNVSNALKIYDGAAWQSYSAASGLTAVVDDAAPSLGGDLDANGHLIAGRDVAADGTKLDGISSGADVTATVIHAASSKATPVDADELGLIDSAASNALKKLTWANLKATLNSVYVVVARTVSAGSGLTGGGDLSANRTIALDISGQSADGSPDVTADYVITYDASASGFKKVLLNLLGDTVNNIKKNVSATLSVGFKATPYSAGTKSSGTYTPDLANGNLQYATNGGAHTLAPPSDAGTLLVEYTNNGSAGAVTTSSFTKVTGDSFTTTNGNKFFCFITKHQNYSHLHVQALQ